MVMTLPRVHVVVAGLDKLVASLDNVMVALQVLPRNANGPAHDLLLHPDGRRRRVSGQSGRQEGHACGLCGQRSHQDIGVSTRSILAEAEQGARFGPLF